MGDFHKQPTLVGGEEPAEAHESPLPETIGPYRVEGELSTGGMSHLYLATHPETHDALAIKVLSPKFLSHPEMKGHFLKEAEIIEMADHPNIVKLYGEGEWEGGLYIAMEFIQGLSLRQFILQHTMSLGRAIEVILQISSALEHLHSHGITHRDLKPENILLTSSGGIKVIDFGIAQLKSNGTSSGSKKVMGTPVYMSPEQQEDPLSVTPASDIYSLAIVAYELILGKISHGQIHLAMMPKGLQPILTKALQPDLEKRYKTVGELSADLNAYLQSDAFEEDQKGRGYAQDLSENIRKAQDTLLPRMAPSWPHTIVGLACHRDYSISGIYYDFFDLGEGTFGVILSEPSSTGVKGTVHAALLQGVIRGLSDTIHDPVPLIRSANHLLALPPFEQVFTLNYLKIQPNARQIEYLSCGYGPLYLLHSDTRKIEKITSENLALGIDSHQDFVAMQHNWDVGDTLILTTMRASGDGEEEFEKALQEVFYAPPQKQAEGLLRRVLRSLGDQTDHRPVTIIAIQNQG